MRQVTAAVSNKTGVYVDFAHIVDDDGDPQAVAIGQHVAEKRCLAGAEKTREHGDRQPVDAVHRQPVNKGIRSDWHFRFMSLIRNRL